MRASLIALIALGTLHPPAPPQTETRAGFVTQLGRDTVALESFTRTAKRLEGDIVLRVPGTVLFHYVFDLDDSAMVRRSRLDVKPMGIPTMAARRVTLDFIRDSVRITFDSAGYQQRATRAAARGAPVLFMTGIGSSFGLYSSLGMYELMLSRLQLRPGDTLSVPSVGAATGRMTERRVLRRSAREVDVDYFRMAWTHLTLDDSGRIAGVDAIETTEKVKTTRTDFIDVPGAAKAFASRDRAGKGIGVASPDDSVRAKLGAVSIFVDYDSPRRRDREILGKVVPYDRVWRTGANEATLLRFDREITIGDKSVPAGTYSVWTLPSKQGVALILNDQVGQWGTEYDPAKDVLRLPMTVTTASTPRENFTIAVEGRGSTGELRILWDTFIWSVPLSVK
jgi:hypothetical protein